MKTLLNFLIYNVYFLLTIYIFKNDFSIEAKNRFIDCLFNGWTI